MKLVIPKKTLLAFLVWTLVTIGLLVYAIDITPKEYNIIIALVFVSSWMYGIVFAKFNMILAKAKKGNTEN